MHDSDTSNEDNDGTWPDGTPVCTPFPITDAEVAGPRSGWPWVTAVIDSQVGPDEWGLIITDPEAVTDDDGTPYYPVVFRDSGEIRLPDPAVQDMRAVFFPGDEDGGHAVNDPAGPRSAYADALAQAADDVDDALACIRAETTAGRVTPAEAAAERAGLLERHLARLERLREQYLGGE